MAQKKIPKSNPMPGRPISVETLVKEALGSRKISKTELRNVVNALEKLEKGGIQFVKGFPYGIPAPDGIGAQGFCSRKGLATLLQALGSPIRIREVAVFPYGIPYPDVFRVNLGVGEVGR